MEVINAKEIRDRFFNFFKSKDHLLIENSSIIPKNDPTLLFINSGMAPLKRYFTGEEVPKSPRLCNIQPCIRTIDIDEIGDKHHLTSFQMLGSWSINDYFKEKAIALAYEFLTEHLNIPQEKLYVTIFSGDESLGLAEDAEAKKYWEKVGMPKDHIVACGKDDNFWGPTSETGPCGPCTEVFYDTGKGKKYVPGGEFDTKERYIEIWNAGVFMQLNKNVDGSYSRLSFTSVDTGAGLERLAMVLNGYDSVYETDMLAPIKEKIKEEVKTRAKNLDEKTVNISERELRILTDHLRTVSLILSEGVKPSNEGRGYIPRKLIRKCIMMVVKFKMEGFDFDRILKFVVDKYSILYNDFKEKESIILSEFSKEREQFEKILINGLGILDEIKESTNEISGQKAFELVTTYGVPFDIIVDYAAEAGMKVDEDEFNKKLKIHKEISRSAESQGSDAANIKLEEFNKFPTTNFKGYEESEIEAKVLDISPYDSKNEELTQIRPGQKITIVLDSTCMYAESGGQVADRGVILIGENKIKVEDVKKTKNNVFVHFGILDSGNGIFAEKALVKVDVQRRRLLANNHSAVHLLHSALRNIFGKDVHQCGSKVEEKGIRFDFNYDKSIEESDLFKIENLVNFYVRENVERNTEIKSLEEAVKDGAIALFDSKYSSEVRVVSFGGISKELCGGTHTDKTGNIGLFCIESVESIGKGIKRISALTGERALNYIQCQRDILKNAAILLKVKQEKINDKISEILKTKNRKNETFEKITLEDVTMLGVKDIKTKDGIQKDKVKIGYVIKADFNKKANDSAIEVADKFNGVVLCIFGVGDAKRLLVTISSNLKGVIKANDVLREIAEKVGGKGGGNEKVASGGTAAEKEEIIKAFSESF